MSGIKLNHNQVAASTSASWPSHPPSPILPSCHPRSDSIYDFWLIRKMHERKFIFLVMSHRNIFDVSWPTKLMLARLSFDWFLPSPKGKVGRVHTRGHAQQHTASSIASLLRFLCMAIPADDQDDSQPSVMSDSQWMSVSTLLSSQRTAKKKKKILLLRDYIVCVFLSNFFHL